MAITTDDEITAVTAIESLAECAAGWERQWSCDPASHEALKSDAAAWSSLSYVGQQITEADEHGPREVLEMRNCRCGSTLAVLL